MLQVALLALRTEGQTWWDPESDGPFPTDDEINELAQLVGEMPHE